MPYQKYQRSPILVRIGKRERLVLWNICFLFRDNGISIQLMKYQMYTEIFVFTLVIFFNIVLPVGKDIVTIRIIGILNTFMTFVIQPLFYLSGDVNFRNRVLHRGLWLAIKTELFETPNAVTPIITVGINPILSDLNLP